MASDVKYAGIRESIHSETHTRIRDTLKGKRLELGLSQRALAKKLCVAHSLISKVESGDRRLDVVELKRYTHALGLDFGIIVELLV